MSLTSPIQCGAHLATSSAPRRPTVLVTGASGVVGSALLPRLTNMDVICLVHRTPVDGGHARSVAGDVRQANLGLTEAEHRALARRVDAVIHCAAVTDFNRRDGSLEATNVEGTKRMLAFAARADARYFHVSTAYLHATADGERGRTAVSYAASKRAGEELVADSAVPHVVLRPSVVIGDSETGRVASFQGLYLVASTILSGLTPIIPFDPAWLIDFLPADVVADAIAKTVASDITSGEYWITAGEKALGLEEAVSLCVALADEVGAPVDPPRFVSPDLFDRLIAPVFLDALPRRIRLTAVKLLEFFGAYLAMDSPLPSSLVELGRLGVMALPDQRTSLLTSLRYWARATGRGIRKPEVEVA